MKGSVDMEKRNLDCVYFRINRNGEWQNICFSDLTEAEMKEILNSKTKTWVDSLCIVLGKVIRAIGDQFDIYIDDGVTK